MKKERVVLAKLGLPGYVLFGYVLVFWVNLINLSELAGDRFWLRWYCSHLNRAFLGLGDITLMMREHLTLTQYNW